MQLSKTVLAGISNQIIVQPPPSVFDLPEKVMQFGTGVLLRGLCDYFIDKANRNGVFNGRIVVVKSTSAGDAEAFDRQDNLYTICSRGISGGAIVQENVINAAISRVVSASAQWQEVLTLAASPSLEVIISNTTEVGLQLVKESILLGPPASYPAKLLAVLHRRFQHFGGKKGSGVVVIPTELIPGNGNILKGIVLELAQFNELGSAFTEWMQREVRFCNSLVDRIVTKDPGAQMLEKLKEELGYDDQLITVCEDYRLWAIEGDASVQQTLSFTQADKGVFVEADIEIYKSLKLHLLNGTHTFSACLAFLQGFETVKEAMNDDRFFAFVKQLMLVEIGSSIPTPIPAAQIEAFGLKVIDRFMNPFLEHRWLNITLQCTTKMRMRNLPVIRRCRESGYDAPPCMAEGFAAYLLFMRCEQQADGKYYGVWNDTPYPVNDDHAAFFAGLWKKESDAGSVVKKTFENADLWGDDLKLFPSFAVAVTDKLEEMLHRATINSYI